MHNFKIINLKAIDSTNEYAKQIISSANSNLSINTIIQSDIQTAGRGTSGNKWLSDNSEGLWFSVIIDYKYAKIPCVSFMPSIAIYNALFNQYKIKTNLKWPNDILLNKRKLSGILCETIPNKALIIGIGINIFQTEFNQEISHKAISLIQHKKLEYDKFSLLNAILLEIKILLTQENSYKELWLQKTDMIGKYFLAKKNDTLIKIKILSLNSQGNIIIEYKNKNTEIWAGRTNTDIIKEISEY